MCAAFVTHRAARARAKLVLVAAFALLLVTAGVGLARGAVDSDAFLWLNALAPRLALTASALSVLGLGASVFVVAAALGVQRPQVVAVVLLAIMGGGLAVQLLKLGLGLPRPAAVFAPGQLHVVGVSLRAHAMPSGHAAMWAAVAALAWWMPPTSWPRPRLTALGLSALAVAGALARAVVGAHWPSDLLVGAGLGVGAAALLMGTRGGRRAVQALAGLLHGRIGSRVMVAAAALTAASLWVSRPDYPLAWPWYGALTLLGAWAARAWWLLHRPAELRGGWMRPGARA